MDDNRPNKTETAKHLSVLLPPGADPIEPYDTKSSQEPPAVSVIIPVYNEEGLIETSIVDLLDRMKEFGFRYEVIITENGSVDDTLELAYKLERKYPQVRVLHSDQPDYGAALRRGILSSQAQFVVCDEIDICDTGFYQRSLEILFSDQADMVVGSKLHRDSQDKRPLFRRTASHVINLMLRVLLGFKGTDTHGLKAFQREHLINTVNQCLVNKDLFASEFVIRAERMRYRVMEIPVEIAEKRAPSIKLTTRVPNVLKNLARLVWAIRVRG